MKFSKEVWAVIPARSGSKSIKHKNIKKFDGLPLFVHSIKIAKKTLKIKKIIFSSDADKYLNIARKFKKINLHKRSKKNSRDNSTDFELFKEIIDLFAKKELILPEFLVHLRPTTPIRKIEHIESAINLLKKNSNRYFPWGVKRAEKIEEEKLTFSISFVMMF